MVTEKTITAITRNGNQWQLTSKEHGLHPEHFDFVILAIPAPQAGALLKDSASRFADLCNSVVMRPCFALMMYFKQRINCQFDGLFINSGPLGWVARNSSKPGRKQQPSDQAETWVLHATDPIPIFRTI